MGLIIKSHNGTQASTYHFLQGEASMYNRIVRDCQNSPLTWYMWYDKTFNISYNGQNEIQIDFLLICEEGVIIVEVKGGNITLSDGKYYYTINGEQRGMARTPLEQVQSYKWALLENGIFDKDKVFIDYVCAFPKSVIESLGSDTATSNRIWDKRHHDSDESFADFCLDLIRKEKYPTHIMAEFELDDIIDSISF